MRGHKHVVNVRSGCGAPVLALEACFSTGNRKIQVLLPMNQAQILGESWGKERSLL